MCINSRSIYVADMCMNLQKKSQMGITIIFIRYKKVCRPNQEYSLPWPNNILQSTVHVKILCTCHHPIYVYMYHLLIMKVAFS